MPVHFPPCACARAGLTDSSDLFNMPVKAELLSQCRRACVNCSTATRRSNSPLLDCCWAARTHAHLHTQRPLSCCPPSPPPPKNKALLCPEHSCPGNYRITLMWPASPPHQPVIVLLVHLIFFSRFLPRSAVVLSIFYWRSFHGGRHGNPSEVEVRGRGHRLPVEPSVLDPSRTSLDFKYGGKYQVLLKTDNHHF